MAGTDAEAVVDLPVGSNARGDHRLTQKTKEGTTFGTDYSDLLGARSPKSESESTADVRTDYNKSGVETPRYLVLTFTGSVRLCACSTC